VVISQFIEEKQKICDAIMQRHFDDKGISLEDLIKDRQKQMNLPGAGKAAGAEI
jgi:capsule polysaccharide modification protein KpsS